MFLLGVFATLLISASAEFCYNDVGAACSAKTTYADDSALPNCNARYGAIGDLLVPLQSYANGHIETSFEFLLMSTHFGNYKANRDGFKGLYRKMSDNAWQKAIDIIKYISQRGGRMNFNQPPNFKTSQVRVFELNELQSLAKALDSQKQLAEEALRLHKEATMTHKDAAVAHYLEEEFMESQSEVVRTLAGHTSDLKSMLKRDAAHASDSNKRLDSDASLATFLFDEYLQKNL